jgi:sulfatase maturation enzyme AslB (radical SAM superfamily)
MKTTLNPSSKELYRLPWSLNESPIGWVEVTDLCNIHCKGCYRAKKSGHKSITKIKEEIDFLIQWRNCDTITLAGGEAILHPEIVEIVDFINNRGLKSMIITNGLALDEALLSKLKNAGLTGVSFHIDTTQKRPEVNGSGNLSETNLNPLRLKYAHLIDKVGGLSTTFGITVDTKNIKDIPVFINWAIENINYVNTLTFIIYRGFPISENIEYLANGKKIDICKESLGYAVSEEEFEKITLRSQNVYSVIKEHFPQYNVSSYLGGTSDHQSIKWLLGNIILNTRGKMFGAFGKKTMELAQTFYHLKTGKYIVHLKKTGFGKKIFLLSLFDKQLRKTLREFLKYNLRNPLRFFIPVKTLNIGIVQPPDFLLDGATDMCAGCPDMCVFEGKLVNSCRLDECLNFGSFIEFRTKSKNLIPETK